MLMCIKGLTYVARETDVVVAVDDHFAKGLNFSS
jgi:hypothetical protein